MRQFFATILVDDTTDDMSVLYTLYTVAMRSLLHEPPWTTLLQFMFFWQEQPQD